MDISELHPGQDVEIKTTGNVFESGWKIAAVQETTVIVTREVGSEIESLTLPPTDIRLA